VTRSAAAERWAAAVNADGSFGRWSYLLVEKVEKITAGLDASL
jgi:hypothetical protein